MCDELTDLLYIANILSIVMKPVQPYIDMLWSHVSSSIGGAVACDCLMSEMAAGVDRYLGTII
jgi:hypothetical protein